MTVFRPPQGPEQRRRAYRFAPCLAWTLIASCALPGPESSNFVSSSSTARKPAKPAGPTQSDRLLAYYADLRDGPFAILADFEDPVHAQVVSLHGADAARFARLPNRGRKETGGACLEFHATSPDDELILSNDHAEQWHLRRQWTDFDLLLLSVHAPLDRLGLNLTLVAAGRERSDRVVTRQPLRKGWNLLRLDIAELAERIALDDVREIRLSVSGSEKPLTLLLDDLLLAANRRDIFGDSAATGGELFVRRSGRRVHVGAGGRFELIFSGAQIVAWYDLARDPYRVRNLVRGTALGPTPIFASLDEESDAEESSAPSTPAVEARTRLLEFNPIRAVVECAWRASAEDADVRARYVVYATGQLFVDVEWPGARPRSRPSPTLVFAAHAPGSDARVIAPAASPDHPSSWGILKPSAHAALWVTAVDQTASPMSITAVQDHERQRLLLLARASEDNPPANRWWVHMLLRDGEPPPSEVVQDWADAFARPTPPQLLLGRVNPSRDFAEGFDRSQGCFRFSLKDSQLRWKATGDDQVPATSAFCVDTERNQKAWVYVNHLIHQPLIATDDGLLFQLPQDTPSGSLIEVLGATQGAESTGKRH